MPREQRYTARKIYEELQKQGYGGSEITVSRYVGQKRRASQAKPVFLPLEFDPDYDDGGQWPGCDPSTSDARRSHDRTMGRTGPPRTKWARFR